jgi:hypothetical protein
MEKIYLPFYISPLRVEKLRKMPFFKLLNLVRELGYDNVTTTTDKIIIPFQECTLFINRKGNKNRVDRWVNEKLYVAEKETKDFLNILCMKSETKK